MNTLTLIGHLKERKQRWRRRWRWWGAVRETSWCIEWACSFLHRRLYIRRIRIFLDVPFFEIRNDSALPHWICIFTCIHFLFLHSVLFRQQRKKRFFERSDILNVYPYAVRIELYQTRKTNEEQSLIAVWKYPVTLDYIPMYRLAKVLYLTAFSEHKNPCFSHPFYRNEQCQELMNNRSEHICLCPANFTGENCSSKDQVCREGYYTTGSLCQSNSRVSLWLGSLPYCLCPVNRFGLQCIIEYDLCFSNPCHNDGSCMLDSQPDWVIRTCAKEYIGPRCE